MNNQVIPAMIKDWIYQMMNKDESDQSRYNRYMMLQYVYKVIGEAIEKYELDLKFRGKE